MSRRIGTLLSPRDTRVRLGSKNIDLQTIEQLRWYATDAFMKLVATEATAVLEDLNDRVDLGSDSVLSDWAKYWGMDTVVIRRWADRLVAAWQANPKRRGHFKSQMVTTFVVGLPFPNHTIERHDDSDALAPVGARPHEDLKAFLKRATIHHDARRRAKLASRKYIHTSARYESDHFFWLIRSRFYRQSHLKIAMNVAVSRGKDPTDTDQMQGLRKTVGAGIQSAAKLLGLELNMPVLAPPLHDR
jgi:hypothetical protein